MKRLVLGLAMALGVMGPTSADTLKDEFKQYVTEPCFRFAIRNGEPAPGVSEEQMLELLMLLQGPQMEQTFNNNMRQLVQPLPFDKRLSFYKLARMACESGILKGK